MDESFHSDLLKIMDDCSDEIKKAYPEGSFASLFWEEHLKAAKSVIQVKFGGIQSSSNGALT